MILLPESTSPAGCWCGSASRCRKGVAPREALGDPPVLLMGARFDPEKRHDLLFQATRRLLDEGIDVEVWLAGAGPTEEDTKQLAQRVGVDGSVRFQGSVPRAVLLEWLASGQVDAAVLPSDGEGLPVFLIEALANYVPAIGTDAGGVAELLGDGCGEVVPLDDADALADAIARVLGTPELRERMVRAGRARVEREFAIESVVLATCDSYSDLRRDAEEALTGRPVEAKSFDLTRMVRFVSFCRANLGHSSLST